MLHFPVSVLREYPLIWRGDPALAQPEIAPEPEIGDSESSADFDARRAKWTDAADAARAKFGEAWERAIATGKWDDLRRAGHQPTVFWCRPIPGALWRRYMDFVSDPDNGVGAFQRPALAFRLAVTRIENFAPGFKVATVDHVNRHGAPSGLGQILAEDVTNVLDGLDEMIVFTLGYAIVKHRGGPHPL